LDFFNANDSEKVAAGSSGHISAPEGLEPSAQHPSKDGGQPGKTPMHFRCRRLLMVMTNRKRAARFGSHRGIGLESTRSREGC
jgi:hypothetical protein